MTHGARPKAISQDRIANLFRPGERVFLPGSSGEPIRVLDALATPDAPPLNVTTTLVPGVNKSPVASLPEGSVWTGVFSHASDAGSQASGRYRHLPLSYGGFTQLLETTPPFETCILQVSRPDENGRCSMGNSVEFTQQVLRRAGRMVLIVNQQTPRIPGAPSVALADADAVVEIDEPVREYSTGAPSPEAQAIAAQIAPLVEDGYALQVGLGKVPDSLGPLLTDRRGLRLHSGMFSDWARTLLEAGALDPDFAHVCCLHAGSADYYRWLDGNESFSMAGAEYTHSIIELMKLGKLVAVNSGLDVDLFGQANLEMAGGRMMSGVGGAPDFSRSATLIPQGVSVLALPSTSKKGASRIVPRIDGMCSVFRGDVEIVVTEHGLADLRGCSVVERAEKLIEIAAPEHRGSLSDAWKEIAVKI